eukprot:gene20579-11764_t
MADSGGDGAAAAAAAGLKEVGSVIIVYKAGPKAPQLIKKKQKVKLKPGFNFEKVAMHLQNLLAGNIPDGTSLFLYVSTWHVTPSLDQTLANLARLFGRENAKGRWILEVEYTIEPAYG